MEKRINIDEGIELNGVEYWANGMVEVVGDVLENYSGGSFWGGPSSYEEFYEFEPKDIYTNITYTLLDQKENEVEVTDAKVLEKLEAKVKQLALNYLDFDADLY